MALYADKKDFIDAVKQINVKFAELDAQIEKLKEELKPKRAAATKEK